MSSIAGRTSGNSRAVPEALAQVLATGSPFSVALNRSFRQTTHREGMVFSGPYGWSEWAPFPEYPPELASRWLLAALSHVLLPPPVAHRDAVPVNAIIPALPAADAADLARAALVDLGVRVLKVKVAEPGQELAEDVRRLAAIRQVCAESELPDVQLRIDANMAWTVPQALEHLAILGEFGLEYVEQPCGTLAELAQVRAHSGVAVAADESLRLREQDGPLTTAQVDLIRDAVDVVILKPTPLGGTQEFLDLAAQVQLPVVVSSAMDTSLGLAHAVRAAAALPQAPLTSGLGTGVLLAQDLLASTLVPHEGQIKLEALPTTPNLALLEQAQARVPAERQRWWHQRLQGCIDYLVGHPPVTTWWQELS